jgi:hypothetical protein
MKPNRRLIAVRFSLPAGDGASFGHRIRRATTGSRTIARAPPIGQAPAWRRASPSQTRCRLIAGLALKNCQDLWIGVLCGVGMIS